MANEVQFRSNLRILKRADDDSSLVLIDKNYQCVVNDDMDGNKGPVGGTLVVTVAGKAVDLSALTRPRWCVLRHTGRSDGSDPEDGDYVEWGIRDPGTNVFYPMGELWAGLELPIPLSRNVLEEYAGTGTGTTAPGNELYLKAWPVSQNVEVGVFEA